MIARVPDSPAAHHEADGVVRMRVPPAGRCGPPVSARSAAFPLRVATLTFRSSDLYTLDEGDAESRDVPSFHGISRPGCTVAITDSPVEPRADCAHDEPTTPHHPMRELPLASAAARLEDAAALDAPSTAIARLIARVPRSIREILHGVPIGHPAHPAAVLVPAGAWISAAVLDLLPGTSRAARTLVGVGVLTALPTAAAGWTDWSTLRTRQQRVGLVHAGANVIAVALYSASWLQRRRGHQLSGVVLGMSGLTLISVAGFLGGHLSYRQSAGANQSYLAPDLIPTGWHRIGMLAEQTDGAPVHRSVNGVGIVLIREQTSVAALVDGCSYCGSPLSSGAYDGSTLTCAHDGSRFEVATGAVVTGPATAPQPRFDALVSEGFVEVAARPA